MPSLQSTDLRVADDRERGILFFAGLSQDSGGVRALAVFGVPLLWFLWMLMLRVAMEMQLVLFRIERNTRRS